MAITFPGSPVEGQTYLAENGFTYIYDSAQNRWKRGGEFVRSPKVLSYAGETPNASYQIEAYVTPNSTVGVDSFKAYRAVANYPNYTEVQFSTDENFGTVAYAATFADTSYTVPSGTLSGNTTYYVRARQFEGSTADATGIATGAISGYSANPVRFITTDTYIDTPVIVSISGSTDFPVYQIGYASTTLPATVEYDGSGVNELERVDWRVTGPRIPSSTGDTALAEIGIGTHSSATLANALVLAMPFSGAEGVGITSDVNNAIRTASGASSGTTKTVTVAGTASTVSIAGLAVTSHFYDSAAYFDGDGDYLTTNLTLDSTFASSDYTIEWWMNSNNDTSEKGIFGVTGNQYGISARQFGSSLSRYITATFGAGTAGNVVDYKLPHKKTWIHVAMVRSGSSGNLYINGSLVGSCTASTSFTSSSLYIGTYYNSGTAGYGYDGYIQDFKVYSGLAKYTENFTPPLPTYGTISYTTGTTYTGINTTAYYQSTGDVGIAETSSTAASSLVLAMPMNRTFGFQDINGSIKALTSGAAPYPNNGSTWSDDLTSGTLKTATAGFDADFTTGRSEGTGGLTFTPSTPIQYGRSVEVYDGNNITKSRVNGGTYVQHATNAWVEVATGSGTITTMDFLRTDNPAFDAGFQGIRVDGVLLVDDTTGGFAKTVGLGTTSTANAPSHPIISSTESKWYDGAAYFDGNGDYASIASNISDFQFGTGDFTLEAYILKTANGVDGYDGVAILGPGAGGGTTGWYWEVSTTRGVYFIINSNSISSNTWVNDGKWHHVAITRSSGTAYIFIDGILKTSSSLATSVPTSGTSLNIGNIYNGTTLYSLNGYLQDLKIYKGLAKYTSDFTPPQPICGFSTDISTQTGFTTTTASGALLSSVVGLGSTSTLAFDADTTYAGITSITSSSGITTLTDPYAQNLVLALPLADITGVGNSFTNDRNTQIRSVSIVGGGTTKTITNNNNVSLATTNKWYDSSAYFNGSNAYLKTSTSEVFTGDFTIECWLNSSNTGTGNIIGDYPGTNSFQFFYGANGYQNIGFYRATSVVSLSPSNSAALRNTWNHIAAVRKDSTLYLFTNGNLQGSTTLAGNVGVGNGWYIGVDSDGTSEDLTGYINDLRVYNGVAKYTTNFTPPPPIFGDYTRSTPNKIIFTPASDYVLEAKNTSGIITSSYSATRQWGTKAEGGIYDPYAGNLRLAYPFNNTTTFYDTTGQIKLETPTTTYSSGQVVTSPSGSTHTNQTVTNPSSAVTFVNTQSKFYGYSAFFDSTTDEIVAQDASLSWGTNDLTIEWWSYRNADSNTYRSIWCSRESGVSDGAGTYITFYGNSFGGFWPSNMGTDEPINQWNHYAICRKSGILYAFVNGVPRGTPTANTTNYSRTTARVGNTIDNYPWAGYIQDFRLYIGLAKYQVEIPFTPPNQIYVA